MVDRDTYTKFMELQLEKVTNACAKVKDCTEKIDTMEREVKGNKDRIDYLQHVVANVQKNAVLGKQTVKNEKPASKFYIF